MISKIHHINFIVRDLRTAVARYQKYLGLGEFQFDSLAKRKVVTARIKLGDSWLVLVQPTDGQGSVAKYLEQHGEGFFLLSFATDDLDSQLKSFEQQMQSNERLEKPRQGLENWRVCDLPMQTFFGAQIQLTQAAAQ
ncbi:MAG: VOC family protein [Acidiferrobacterales bacterium]|nr:VOC family protein [Acidiferrobacterales bacterium]